MDAERRVNYDGVAATYHQRYDIAPLRQLEAFVLSLAAQYPGGRLLEVGCGTGCWLSLLDEQGYRVFGLDFSDGMLRQARRRRPGLRLCRGQAERLPFADGQFDLLLCVNALHHFGAPEQFIAGARRVLRPGGTLAIVGMDPHDPATRWYVYDYFEGAQATDRVRFTSAATLQTWLRAAGFDHLERRTVQSIRDRWLGRAVFADPFLQKNSTSQLILLSDAAYAAGLARLEADIARAEARGETPVFITENDLFVHLAR